MRLYKILLAITLNATLLMQPAAAQDGIPATTPTELPKCNADAKKALRGMCMYVGSRDYDPEGNYYDPQAKYRYMYQKKIFEAACVDPIRDSDEIIAAKVSRTWLENESILKCSNAQFDVQYGSLIKYAVNANFTNFIFDAIHWKINLNKIDDVDGRTVLDYVKQAMVRNENTSFKSTLEYYYKELRKAGAKHASEL